MLQVTLVFMYFAFRVGTAHACGSSAVYVHFDGSKLISEGSAVDDTVNCTSAISRMQCCHCTNISHTASVDIVCSNLDEVFMLISTMDAIFDSVTLILDPSNSMFQLEQEHHVHNISMMMEGGNINVSDNGNLVFSSSPSVIITGSNFTCSESVGAAVLTMDGVRNVAFRDVHIFQCSTTALHIDLTLGYHQINFTNCIFNSNGNTHQNGGAISIQSSSMLSSKLKLSVCDCAFNSNKANHGAAIFIDGLFDYSMIFIVDTNFTDNSASVDGGAAFISSIGYLNVTCNGCNFYKNIARNNGGAVCSRSISKSSGLYKFEHCRWESNMAYQSASLYLHQCHAQLLHCSFTNNTVTNRTSLVEYFDCNALILGQVTINDVQFDKTTGSALCADHAHIKFTGNASFVNNSGFRGAAIDTSDSYIQILPHVHVYFIDNNAVYGAGIYSLRTDLENHCLFDYGQVRNLSGEFHFINNHVLIAGGAVYYDNPSHDCINEAKHFKISGSGNQLASSAINITLNNTEQFQLFLGQSIILEANVRDIFNNYSSTQVSMYLINLDGTFRSTEHTLNGGLSFSLATGTNNHNITITGPNITESSNVSYILRVVGMIFPLPVDFNVNLVPCPIGYEYKKRLNKCTCANSQDLLCDFNSHKPACIIEGLWYGSFKGRHITLPCVTGYCSTLRSTCQDCFIFLNIDGYCSLSDDNCISNRHGLLCTGCKLGYAFTFGAVECAPFSENDLDQEVAGIIVCSFVFLVLMMVAIMMLLKLDYKLSLSNIYSLLYFYTVIADILPSNITESGMWVFISIIQTFIHLNPRILGYAPWTFTPNVTVIQHTAILYLIPTTICLLVVAVICVSKVFSKLIKFNDNSFVKTICLLSLLCITSLTATNFTILNPIQLTGIGGVYVFAQPKTSYGDTKEHLPYLLIAIATEALLVLPFTILLVASSQLSRCFNLIKLKPFLDEFQGSYKDRYRWMAGYYLVCRHIILIILAVPTTIRGIGTLGFALRFASFGIAIFHIIVRPYQSNWLNTIDFLILCDIGFLSLFSGDTSKSIFKDYMKELHALLWIGLLCPVILIMCRSFIISSFGEKVKERVNSDCICRKLQLQRATKANNLRGEVRYRDSALLLADNIDHDTSASDLETPYTKIHVDAPNASTLNLNVSRSTCSEIRID